MPALETALVVLGAVLALGAAAAAGALLLAAHRQRTIGAWVGTFECALATEAGWQAGLGQFGADRLAWWQRWSLAAHAQRAWPRDAVEVIGRTPAPGGDQLLVQLACRGERVELAMSPDAYAGLTSWIEAAPRHSRTII